MKLNEASSGDACIVLSMEQERSTKQLMLVNGLFVGAKLNVNRNDSLRQLMHLTIGGRIIAIRQQDAAKISIEKLD